MTDVILNDCVKFPWEKLPDLTNLADGEALGVKDSKGRATFSRFMAGVQNPPLPELVFSPWPCHIPNMPQHTLDSFVYLAQGSQELVVWSMGTLIMLNSLMNELLPCLAGLTFLPGCCQFAEADAGGQGRFALSKQQRQTHFAFRRNY